MERTGFDRRRNHRLALPLGASLLVHSLALSFFLPALLYPLFNSAESTSPTKATPVLRVELHRQQTTAKVIPPGLVPEGSSAATTQASPATISDSPTERVATKRLAPKRIAPKSIASARVEAPSETPAEALREPSDFDTPSYAPDLSTEFAKSYLATPCSPAQRASKIRNCDDDFDIRTQRDQRFAWMQSLFPSAPFANKDFSADMRQVDALLEQSAALDQLAGTDAVGAQFIATQQRHIREEIARIDKKYTTVNLLEVIPRTLRVARSIGERLQE